MFIVTEYAALKGDRVQTNTTIIGIGPASTRQRNAIKWRFAGVPMMATHWILALLLCDFSGDPDLYC